MKARYNVIFTVIFMSKTKKSVTHFCLIDVAFFFKLHCIELLLFGLLRCTDEVYK